MNTVKSIKSTWPEGAFSTDWMTSDEINEIESRVFAMVRATPEDELPIYDAVEEIDMPLDEEEKDELPAGTLLRDPAGFVIVKTFLDSWTIFDETILNRPERPLEKYGRMRLTFLEHYRVWDALAMGENLLEHCLSIQDEADALKENLMEQLERKNPPPDKKTDPMGWVRRMNALDAQAEEIVTRTVVYREPDTGVEKPEADSERMEQESEELEKIFDRIIARMKMREAGYTADKDKNRELPF